MWTFYSSWFSLRERNWTSKFKFSPLMDCRFCIPSLWHQTTVTMATKPSIASQGLHHRGPVTPASKAMGDPPSRCPDVYTALPRYVQTQTSLMYCIGICANCGAQPCLKAMWTACLAPTWSHSHTSSARVRAILSLWPVTWFTTSTPMRPFISNL